MKWPPQCVNLIRNGALQLPQGKGYDNVSLTRCHLLNRLAGTGLMEF